MIPQIICGVGPTATGKTKMGVALAHRFGGGADGHAPVDLHGVHADDFAPKAPGQFQAQIALPAGRRARNGDYGGLFPHGNGLLYCTRLKRFSSA